MTEPSDDGATPDQGTESEAPDAPGAAEAALTSAREAVVSGRRITVALVLIAAVAIAWPFIVTRLGVSLFESPARERAAVEERIAALEDRLAESDRLGRVVHGELAKLAAAVAGLEEQLAQRGDGGPAAAKLRAEIALLREGLVALAQRVEAEGMAGDGGGAPLARRLAALERAFAQISEDDAGIVESHREALVVAADVLSLTDRLDVLEHRLAAGADLNQALALAVGQLREAARGAEPFPDALATVQALAGDERGLAPPIEVLGVHAGGGAPTLEGLRARFSILAGTLARSGGDGAAARSWLEATLDRLAGLVDVRRTGEVEGRSPEARVARAERRLAEGDLGAAVAEVAALEGGTAEAAAGWLAAARARLAVDGAVAELQTRAMARLAETSARE